jgi:hypothetical protein
MPHVSFRDWQVRAAVVLVVALAFSALASTVQAAQVTSFSGATLCTSPGDPAGNCSYQTSGSSTAFLAGQFDTPAVLIDQSLCPAQAADAIDLLCGHFSLDVGAATGTITVTINFNQENDFDLCIVEGTPPLATNVGCSTGTGSSETVTITLNQCVDPHFEAQILPISFGFPGPTPATPATYTGTVTSRLTVCGPPPLGLPVSPSGAITALPSAPDPGLHRVTGGGKIASGNISNRVVQRRGGGYDGKVRYSGLGCDLRSTAINSVVWDDLNKRATIVGKASINRGAPVDFVLTLADNGAGPTDFYDMKSLCGGTGTLIKGNLDYRVR